MMILYGYDHLEQTHSLIQYQHTVIESLELREREMELRLLVSETGVTNMDVMISCLQHQLAQIMAWILVCFGLW